MFYVLSFRLNMAVLKRMNVKTLMLLGVLTALCLGKLTGADEGEAAKNKAIQADAKVEKNSTNNSNSLSSTNKTDEEDVEGNELSTENEINNKYGTPTVEALHTDTGTQNSGKVEVTTETGTTEGIQEVTTEEPLKKEPLFTLEQLEALEGPWSCDSHIYCQGPLLDAVQRSGIFPDSKTFVDMSLKQDPDVVLKAYKDLVESQGPLSSKQLETFINEHFSPPGEELEPWQLPDWQDSPQFLEKISDSALKKWASVLHKLWATLGRRIKASIPANSTRHSLLHVPNGFVIPGDRFREFYYWDTYWIIKGLLVSGMTNTSRGVIENLLYMVKEYGMVPNGGRVYYKNRSQPPLLSSMVNAYYEATNDAEFITEIFDLLEREYQFWSTKRSVTVTKDGKDYNFARYKVQIAHPRAEGYLEDLEAVRGFSAEKATTQFSHLTSGAESGWDYSTRWFTWKGEDEFTLRSIKTTDIVPVDLNTFLYLTETYLSKFSAITGQEDKTKQYTDLAVARKAAMEAVFWNEEDGTWYDYDLSTNTSRRRFFLSNITPLLTKPDVTRIDRVIQYLKNEKVLIYPGGVPTSSMLSWQQWDFPNAWAPLIDILVTGLRESSSKMAQELAFNISDTWVATNYAAWAKTGHMYEKYNVRKLGGVGRGGEYKVQVGFGWTNGVILDLLNRYGKDLRAPDVKVVYNAEPGDGNDGNQGTSASTKVSFVFIPVILLFVCVFIFICFMKRNIKQRAKRPSTGLKYTAAPFQKFDN